MKRRLLPLNVNNFFDFELITVLIQSHDDMS